LESLVPTAAGHWLVEVVKKLSPQVDAAIAERKSSVTAMLPNAHPEAICKPDPFQRSVVLVPFLVLWLF
jgi:hypothetical protein